MSKPLRVVVVGSGGRMGAAIVRHLRQTPDQFRVVAYDHKSMDLLQPEKINDHLQAIRFDALINCAAMTSLEHCEDRPVEATQANATAAGQMAEICRNVGARMIQISTDYVYDGTQPGKRRESDPVAPLGHYAKTKLEGDNLVLAASDSFLVARTSWVFGPDRPSFIDQLLKQAIESDAAESVGDKFSAPSYSQDLAKWLGLLLSKPEVTGVLNLCNTGDASWHTYAQYAVDVIREMGYQTKTISIRETKLADMKHFRAPRPRFTAMDNSRLQSILVGQIRPWRDALREYLQTFYVLNTTPH